MALKGLSALFDNERFFGPKKFQVTGCSEWKDFDTKAHCGSKIEVVILEDGTDYGANKMGKVVTNQFEKLVVKVAKDIAYPLGTQVILVDPKASIYGQYLSSLSITAADILPAAAKSNPKGD